MLNLYRYIVLTIALISANAWGAEITRLDQLAHLHAIATQQGQPEKLLVAAHSGLYLANPNGNVERVSSQPFDVVALASDPNHPKTWLASGATTDGLALGLLKSEDGGIEWRPLSPAMKKPDIYRFISISGANSKRVYAVTDQMLRSDDGGITWQSLTPIGQQAFKIASSHQHKDTVYAATRNGLYVSNDAGTSWSILDFEGLPVSAVQTQANGDLFAFVLSKGLLKSNERTKEHQWQVLNNALGHQALVDLAITKNKAYGLNQFRSLISSNDRGKTWQRYTGNPTHQTKQEKHGAELFQANCQQCHGNQGVGETFNERMLTDRSYSAAIPLDDTSHAWHHEDEQLVQTILEGGIARGGRMPSWKGTLSTTDAEALVAYIKTLWSEHIREDCQGRKHMSCMQY